MQILASENRMRRTYVQMCVQYFQIYIYPLCNVLKMNNFISIICSRNIKLKLLFILMNKIKQAYFTGRWENCILQVHSLWPDAHSQMEENWILSGVHTFKKHKHSRSKLIQFASVRSVSLVKSRLLSTFIHHAITYSKWSGQATLYTQFLVVNWCAISEVVAEHTFHSLEF